MFYNNRKTIYISLIIIALIFSVVVGEKIGNGIADTKVTKTTIENTNYNNTLSIKGNKYSLVYSVTNALSIDKSLMVFNLFLQDNSNVKTIKVVAKDQDNNNLAVDPTLSDDSHLLRYDVMINSKTSKISISIYPLTKKMASNNKLDLSTIPFQTSTLYVSLLKQA